MSDDATTRRTGRADVSFFLGHRSRPSRGIEPVGVGNTATGGERWTLAWSVNLVALLLAVAVVRVDAQRVSDRFGRLFVATETPTAQLTSRPDAAVLRERLVRLDHDVLAAARRNAGRADVPPAVLRLDLFDDAALHAVVERTGPTSAGYWLSGRIEEWALGSITLVANEVAFAGTVRAPTATYAIRSVGDGVHAVRQLDTATVLAYEDDSVSPAPLYDEDDPSHPASLTQTSGRAQPIRPAEPSTIRRTEALPEEDGSRIDIMVVYTRAAREEAGGDSAIRALIDLRIVETNHAYLNSGVHQQMHLAWTAEVDYRGNPGDVRSPVDRLIHASDGYMDEVHVLRDRYKADLVHLVLDSSFTRPGSTCTGEAKLVRDPSSRDAAERTPFSSTTTGCDSVVFAHETGHSMGLRHDRYAEIHGCCGQLNMAYPYSHGYVNQRGLEPAAPASSRWYTIMTSNSQQCRDAGYSCEALLRFSNPKLTYNGDPMGVPGNEPSSSVTGPADARRSLNETRTFVANFRVAPCLRDGMPVQLQASNGQYVVAVGNGGGDVLAVGSHLGSWGEFTLVDLVDANGGCVESGDAVSLHTSDGFYLRARQGGGSTLDATDPQATPWAQFVARRYRGAGAIRNLDSITLQVASGHYVCAEEGGGSAVRADCDGPGSWGTFKASAADATSTDRNWLAGGQRLLTGHSIRAEAAACKLVFQTDGNLVAYNEGVAYWHSRTAGAASGGSAVMQSDGNLVVYDTAGVARWWTGTAGNPGAFLIIERDCNVVLRSAGGTALWSTGQSH